MARRSGPIDRREGYAKGDTITDARGNHVGTIIAKSCSRVRPGQRGAWISGQRCSYTVKIGHRIYVGRGRGDGMFVNLRQKRGKGPGLFGLRSKKRRKR